jgi:hypothetical protein
VLPPLPGVAAVGQVGKMLTLVGLPDSWPETSQQVSVKNWFVKDTLSQGLSMSTIIKTIIKQMFLAVLSCMKA